jgi:hypothetical protein
MIGLTIDRLYYSPIHILNDDVLLHIFDLYRLADPDEYDDETGPTTINWHRQRWWYNLAQVCQLWRNIILGSPSRLDLHLLCTNGVPVADMLAHSPPLPLTIQYRNYRELEMTTEDESGILLALSHRDRVRHIHLPNVGKFVAAMDDQFPILERMYINSWSEVILPVTFQAPNLCHLKLWRASIPIRSPLLTTAAGLVTLELKDIPGSVYFPPSYILTRISFMLQLESLSIGFRYPHSDRDVERQLHQIPDMIVLPNLRFFLFTGTATYLDGLVARISAPFLNRLHVYLDHQPSFTFLRLLQFIQTSENLGFTAVQVTFSDSGLFLYAAPPSRKVLLQIWCVHLDWQVTTAVQLFGTLSPVLSVVEHVTFSYQEHYLPRASYNVDRSQWRELLRPLANAKTIHVHDYLVSNIFCSLPSEDGGPPLEFLPNLEEVGYSGESDVRDAFITFLNGRQAAGHPVTLRIVDRSVLEDRYS